MKKLLLLSTGVLGILMVWACCSLLFTPTLVPYPHQVLVRLVFLLAKPDIYYHLWLTIFRTLLGFILAFITGTIIGLFTGAFQTFEEVTFIPVVLLQASPPILWVVPLVLILGTGSASPVAVIYFVTLPLVIINIQEGRKAINPSLWDMFRIYANSRKMILKELLIPSLNPYIKSIIIVGVVLAFKSSIVGEWFGSRGGIGRIINQYYYNYDMLSFYPSALLYLIIVTLVTFGCRKLSKVLFPPRISTKVVDTTAELKEETLLNNHCSFLRFTNTSFSYSKKEILHNTNFELNPGKTAVLTGKSGCGKTTFVKLATGLLKPDRGRIDIPLNSGFIFQDDALLNHLDCVGNASLPARWKKYPDSTRRALYFLEKCGLKGYTHLFPDQLSGGMKKRVALARAMVLNPCFMILDEPFNNLDKTARQELWNLYFQLFAMRSIPSLIITHYPEELVDKNVDFYELKNKQIVPIDVLSL